MLDARGTNQNSTIVAKRIEDRYIKFMVSAGFDPAQIVFDICDLEYWSYIVPFKKFETVLTHYVKKPHAEFLEFHHTIRLANLCATSNRHMPYSTWYILWLSIYPIYRHLTEQYLSMPISNDDITWLIQNKLDLAKITKICFKIKASMPTEMHNVTMLRRELDSDNYRMSSLLAKITGSSISMITTTTHILDKRSSWELDINE